MTRSIYHLLVFASIFLFTEFNLIAQEIDPVLFEIEDNKVHVSEFKYIYEKNNRDNADYSEKTLTEYLDLYKKFKLKVQKAKSMKLDTLPSLIAELSGYRRQLAKSYLVDNEVSEKLVKEVYERQMKDRKIAHIFFNVDKYAPPARVEKRRLEAMKIYEKLQKGDDFNQLCKSHSEDKSNARKGGVLGYFAVPMPDGFYELETAMCNLEPDQVSKPVRTNLGFHIVKLLAERPARGEMEIAHIMVKKKIKGKTLMNAKQHIDSLYQRIKSGEDFKMIAEKYSQDKKTAKKGGYLGFFGIGTYDPVFEDAAFALKNDQDVSRVIETKLGFHIIKRISKQNQEDYIIAKKRIKAKIMKDARFDQSKSALVERIKKESNFTLNQNVLDKFIQSLDSKFYTYSWKSTTTDDRTLISFGSEDKYSVRKFSDFCRSKGNLRAKFSKRKPIEESVNELLQIYIDDKAIAYEEKDLEDKYPDFRSLMREYEEGILLFEATKLNVWDRASKDSIGLANFYAQNKANYMWNERANIEEFLIDSDNKKVANKVYKCAKKNKRSKEKILGKINKKGKVLEVNTSIAERNVSKMTDMNWESGARSKLLIDTKNKRSSFRRIAGFLPSKMKTLTEARGYVIADYQDHLESMWVKDLNKEFPITLNKDVFKSLIK